MAGCDDALVSERIWPGQKVAGHDVAIARISRAANRWHATCSCGFAGAARDRHGATLDREAHIRLAVENGAEIIGGGRQPPSGP